jgi:hypothetical protein
MTTEKMLFYAQAGEWNGNQAGSLTEGRVLILAVAGDPNTGLAAMYEFFGNNSHEVFAELGLDHVDSNGFWVYEVEVGKGPTPEDEPGRENYDWLHLCGGTVRAARKEEVSVIALYGVSPWSEEGGRLL